MKHERDLVEVVCRNGHPQRSWGLVMKAPRGEAVFVGAIPLTCGTCGTTCRGRS